MEGPRGQPAPESVDERQRVALCNVHGTSDRRQTDRRWRILSACVCNSQGQRGSGRGDSLVTFNELLWIAEINNDREVTEKLDAI